MYLRLNPKRRFRQITYGIMIFVTLYSLVSILVFTLMCIPVEAQWDITLMPKAHCIDQLKFIYANAACNIISDIVTLVLPIKLCWQLQATIKLKILLMGVFTAGSL